MGNAFKKLTNAVSGAFSGAAAGSVLGPIGAIGGGLLGGISGASQDTTDWDKKNYGEAVRQFNINDEYNKNLTQYRVTDALKAGIHPLAALGQSANYSPTISSSGSGDGNNGYVERQMSRIQEIMSGQDLESRDLDLESKRLQNLLLKQKIANMQNPASDPVTDPITLADVARNPDLYSLKDVGKPHRFPELLKKWRLPDGRIIQLIDSDAIADTDWSNIEGDRAILNAYPHLKDAHNYSFIDKFRHWGYQLGLSRRR